MSDRIRKTMESAQESMLSKFERDQDLSHPGTKGSIREGILIEFLKSRLPSRFGVVSGHVVNSRDEWTSQQDIIIYDQLESPLVEDAGSAGKIVLAESVYSTIEVKSILYARDLADIGEKAKSVRDVLQHRSFLGGFEPPLPLCLGFAYRSNLAINAISKKLIDKTGVLFDALCVLEDADGRAGFFVTHQATGIKLMPPQSGEPGGDALSRFLFEILTHLQGAGTTNRPRLNLRMYQRAFGLTPARRLKSLLSKINAGIAVDIEIFEAVALMGEAAPDDLFQKDKAVFAFDRGLKGGQSELFVWTTSTNTPVYARVVYAAARRKLSGTTPQERDQEFLSVVVQGFRAYTKGEELVVQVIPELPDGSSDLV